MPRKLTDDVLVDKVVYAGKIFMYNEVQWNILFPIVDIIRILKKNTIIGYKYGKGQKNIQMYGLQYLHNVVGNDLKTKKDYLENFKAVKCIFLFIDQNDTVATNLINLAQKNKINLVCYSTLDAMYHFYENGATTSTKIKKAEDVVAKMYEIEDTNAVKKIADLFPDFEIIEKEETEQKGSLEECMDKLKISTQIEKEKIRYSRKVDNYLVLYDPHGSKLKTMEYNREQNKIKYNDEPAKTQNTFTRFFKKVQN